VVRQSVIFNICFKISLTPPKCQSIKYTDLKQDKHDNIKKCKATRSFKLLWVIEQVEIESKDSGSLQCVQLSELSSYTEDRGVACLSCVEAEVSLDFAEGKTQNSQKTT
jgi:hypothetical protein